MTEAKRDVPWIDYGQPFDPAPVAHAICDLFNVGADCHKFGALCHIVYDAWFDGIERQKQWAAREVNGTGTECTCPLFAAILRVRKAERAGDQSPVASNGFDAWWASYAGGAAGTGHERECAEAAWRAATGTRPLSFTSGPVAIDGLTPGEALWVLKRELATADLVREVEALRRGVGVSYASADEDPVRRLHPIGPRESILAQIEMATKAKAAQQVNVAGDSQT